MPRFNLISKDGDGVGFAIRLQNEGNDVRVFIETDAASPVGDGLIPKVGSINEMLLDADTARDIFIFDLTGDGIAADYIRDLGFTVIGDSRLASRLEHDRDYGLEVMEKAGIQIPESTHFTSFDDAREFVESNSNEKLVYKPSNLLGDKSPSHVAYNAEDMLQLLDNVENEVAMANPEFVLQSFHAGIALSTEIWFDGSIALPLMNHTLERKELMNGNLGPSGGCTGNLVWACDDGEEKKCPLCKEAQKLIPFLKENSYHGPIDLNVIVAEDGSGVYGLEFTPRIGYDATPTLLWQLIDGDVGHFLGDISRRQYGTNSPIIKRGGFGAGLRLTIPPWPTEKYTADADIPIFGLSPKDLEDVYLYNVKKGERTALASAGVWGILMLFTGSGDSAKKAFKMPQKLAEDIHVSNKQYRTDLVEEFQKDLDTLEGIL